MIKLKINKKKQLVIHADCLDRGTELEILIDLDNSDLLDLSSELTGALQAALMFSDMVYADDK